MSCAWCGECCCGMGGEGAETKAVNCGEVGGAGVASMVRHVEKSLSVPPYSLSVMGNPLTTPEGRRMSLLIPSKPATFTTHYSLRRQRKGDVLVARCVSSGRAS